jgi:hypothetical protein
VLLLAVVTSLPPLVLSVFGLSAVSVVGGCGAGGGFSFGLREL